MTLAHDANDAQLQYVAQDVDGHDLLYETVTAENINRTGVSQSSVEGFWHQITLLANYTAPSQHENSVQSPPGLSLYFRTLPPSNPFASHIGENFRMVKKASLRQLLPPSLHLEKANGS